jgi:D-glycero-D-manno-heptose 1,7-bisphosphate phosphatase
MSPEQEHRHTDAPLQGRKMNTRRAVFLDLNGTLVLPLKQETLDEMYLIPGADLAVRRLLAAGFVCPVVTIQARIEKGLFSGQDFRVWFREFFRKHDLDVKGPYVCPHRFNHPCPCKKPSPLLYEQAAADLQLNLPESYAVGDSPEDVLAAIAFGGTGCLVRTGWAADGRVVEAIRSTAHFVGPSIAEAADWIVARNHR